MDTFGDSSQYLLIFSSIYQWFLLMDKCWQCLIMVYCTEKLWAYHCEWRRSGSPKAKAQGAARPKGFGRGTSRGFPWLFATFTFLSFRTNAVHCVKKLDIRSEFKVHKRFFCFLAFWNKILKIIFFNENSKMQKLKSCFKKTFFSPSFLLQTT